MTIDAGWSKTVKQLSRHAFQTERPALLRAQPHVVFIDGQIKLMKAEWINSWSEFLRAQFYKMIDQAFADGARVVVLGFDDYAHVPSAKSPTQRKRSNHVKALTFHESDELPASMPAEWNSAMRNRVFKTKVVGLITRNVAERYKDSAHTLIIDWVGAPVAHGRALELPPLLRAEAEGGEALRRGECDVKAFAWMHLGLPLLIESTDGDFLPMSLLQLARTGGGEGADPPPQVILHRMLTNVDGAKAKRGASGRAKREYEYVHVNAVLPALAAAMHPTEFASSLSPDGQRQLAQATAHSFALLVATTGCDFCLSLPGLGPTRLWALRNGSVLMPGVSPQRRSELWETRPVEVLLHACIKLYSNMFRKHIPGKSYHSSPEQDLEVLSRTYGDMHARLTSERGPALRLPPWSVPRLLAHLRNTVWTVEYWSTLHEFPDPLQVDDTGTPLYGFCQQQGRVVFVGT